MGLVEMPFGSFYSLRVVFLDVLRSEEWPSYKISSLDSLEPSGFDQVTTDFVHPFDGLFSGGEVVDTDGLAVDGAHLL